MNDLPPARDTTSDFANDPNPETRSVSVYKLVAYAAGGLLLAIAALLVPIPFQGRGVTAAGDLVHAPLFGSLALGVLAILQQLRPLRRAGWPMLNRCLRVGAALFALGVLIEFVQTAFGRLGNVSDAINNGLGISAALLVYWGWQLQHSRLISKRAPRGMYVAAGMLIAVAWWNPVIIILDARSVMSDFPSLATFESTIQLSRFYARECQLRLSRENVTQGKHSMEIDYEATEYPATTLVELQHDWSQLKTFEVDVTLDVNYPHPNVEFMIKIIDQPPPGQPVAAHQGQWTLEPGKTQHICISREEILRAEENRVLDLTNIRYVDLIVLAPAAPAKVRVDDLRLTLQEP